MSEGYQPFQPLLTEPGLESFSLELKQVRAKGLLSNVVHSFLQVSTQKATAYPIVPDGTQAVFISPQAAQVGGALSCARDLQLPQPGDYFGIRFYPGALRHFFDLNLADIKDQFVDASFFPCPRFLRLPQEIFQQRRFRQRARVCEQWLLGHFTPRRQDAFDRALEQIYASFGSIEINKLAENLGLSSRHINRLFKQYTGLSTKAFTQTVRIQGVCKQLFDVPQNTLKAALEFGYFDQAHLLKDYKQRLRLNPASLFERFMSDFYKR